MKDLRLTMKYYREFVTKEKEQTEHMLITFKEMLEKQLGGNTNPSEEDIYHAIEQLKDLGKITALVPLAVLPGSVLTIPLLVKLGKRYDIEILPTIRERNKKSTEVIQTQTN